jgi:hypothetical protein
VRTDVEQLRRVPKFNGTVLCATARGEQAPRMGRPCDSLDGRAVVMEKFFRFPQTLRTPN